MSVENVTLDVRVEHHHIDRGICDDPRSCALALAIANAVRNSGRGLLDVEVSHHTVQFKFPYGEWGFGELPDVAVDFVQQFDSGFFDPDPIRFDMDIEVISDDG